MFPAIRPWALPRRVYELGLVLGLVSWMTSAASPSETDPDPRDNTAEIEFFERRIRPILVQDCYECHGARRAEGGLRVDHRDGLRRGGESGPAIQPGHSSESLLFQSISHQSVGLEMPKDRAKLPDEVIRDFAIWIDQGAIDPRDSPPSSDPSVATDWNHALAMRRSWWSFQPIQTPTVPSVQNANWSQHPIDRFVLSQLEKHGLSPALPASPTTWLRRVHFAIIGLPPTADQVAAFTASPTPLRRIEVVEALLASPQFGERWARHWMDLVRYAESYGHEQDYEIRHAWQYRDYLIRALNADIPYSQLLTEHIAGDLVATPRRHPLLRHNESVLGTAFWYLHQATHAPVDPLQDEADRIDNQIDVFSKTFLGLTVACARCHDHKFDPISTQDYYSLAAFLRSSRQDVVRVDPDGTLETQARRLQTLHAYQTESLRRGLQATTISVAKYLLSAQEILRQVPSSAMEVTDVTRSQREALLMALSAEHDLQPAVLRNWVQELESPAAHRAAHPLFKWRETQTPATSAKTPPPAPHPSTSESPCRPDFTAWFASGHAFPQRNYAIPTWRVTGQQLELLGSNLAHSGILADGLQGALRSPTFTIEHDNLHLHVAGRQGQVRLVIARYALREFNPLLFGETLFDVNTEGTFEWRTLNSDIRRHKGKQAYLELVDDGDGYIALDAMCMSDDAVPPNWPAFAPTLSPLSNPTECAHQLETAIQHELQAWLDRSTPPQQYPLLSWVGRQGLWDDRALDPSVTSILASMRDASSNLVSPMRALAITEGTVEPTYVMVRGNPTQLGPRVHQRFLEVISGPEPLKRERGSGRLELANLLVDPQNPLVNRVIVNRIWAHLFGNGIVPSVDNFGALGQKPTHPELLDFLAHWFRTHDSSIKQLIRFICLSETFGMSSHEDAAMDPLDPRNELLHRRVVQRLECEAIRDSLLAVSGSLDPQSFGPSVPTFLSPFMGDPFWLTARQIGSGPLDGNRRRSVYLETRRNFLSPTMLAFDLPLPDTTQGLRNTSNVPAQSLAMMNDPFVHQMAHAWAQEELRHPMATPEQRIERLFLGGLGRPATPAEKARILEFVHSQATIHQVQAAEIVADERVWCDVCHVMLMLKEFTYVP